MSEREEFAHYLRVERQLSANTVQQYLDITDQWKRSGDDGRVFVLDSPAMASRKRRRAALASYHKFTGETFDAPVIRSTSSVEPLYADRAQIEGLLVYLRDHCDYSTYLLAALMYRTGMRPAEACGLNISSINFATRMVRVTGKGDKQRWIPLREEIIRSLKRWIGFIRPSRVNSRNEAGERLLLGVRGGVMSENTSKGQRWRDELYQAYEACELWKPHDKPVHWLRHMFATHGAEEGLTLPELMYLMGHNSPATTMIYIHRAGLKVSRDKMEAADAAYFGRGEEDNRPGPAGQLELAIDGSA